MVLRRIDRSEYTEYLNYARGCTANQVYPLSIATGTQDGFPRNLRSSYSCYRIVANIADDSREILPVSSVLQGEYGVQGVSASVLSIIGRNGIEDILEITMTDEERDAFHISIDTIRQAAKSEGIIG